MNVRGVQLRVWLVHVCFVAIWQNIISSWLTCCVHVCMELCRKLVEAGCWESKRVPVTCWIMPTHYIIVLPGYLDLIPWWGSLEVMYFLFGTTWSFSELSQIHACRGTPGNVFVHAGKGLKNWSNRQSRIAGIARCLFPLGIFFAIALHLVISPHMTCFPQ